MKAFHLINSICENGLDNTMMMVFEYQNDTHMCQYFGKQYHIVHKESNINDGDKFLAVWSTRYGNPRIYGTADIILECEPTDKIYLYSIE